ncbi:MAG TPA: flagellar basal body P-ring formation chaperone FlgA [Bryobacteraceae bacterium]|jgi:flagella basal body P-ring formation protein FlgA
MTLPFFFALATPPEACHLLETESVLARDAVQEVPGFAQLPGDFLLGYVAATGTARIFRGADLERLAKNRGVVLTNLPDICFARKTFIPQPDAIRAAMQKALGTSNANIELLASSQNQAPFGEVVFPRTGVQFPSGSDPRAEIVWQGHVRFGENGKSPIWARVRVTAAMTRVVAVSDLPAGKMIQKDQVRLESCEDSPLDETAARNLDEVIGLQPRNSLRANTAVHKTQLEHPADVAVGDLVKVEVFDGGAHLILEAQARTAGVVGATVQVRNPSSGKDFQARVTGKDRVTVGSPSGGRIQ